MANMNGDFETGWNDEVWMSDTQQVVMQEEYPEDFDKRMQALFAMSGMHVNPVIALDK